MERPLRKDFEWVDQYHKAVDKYFDHIEKELQDEREEKKKLIKDTNKFIIQIAELLGIDTDGIGYDELELTIDDFEEAINKKSKWISVDDRLPEEKSNQFSDMVLTSTKAGGIDVYRYDFEFNRFAISIHHMTITHWQPLPDKPN